MEKGYTDLMVEVIAELKKSKNKDELVLVEKIHKANNALTHKINELDIMMSKMIPTLRDDQLSSFYELMGMLDRLKD